MSIPLLARADLPGWKVRRPSQHLPVNRLTIAASAIVIAYVDGFWVTSLRGAVGTVEANQSPFSRWLRDSTLMLAPLTLAVLAALVLTRRWVGRSRREMVQLSVAALLLIVISTTVSIAEVATMSAHDYSIQARQLELVHTGHLTTVAGEPGTVDHSGHGGCAGLCAARQATLTTHVRAVGYASVVLLATNLALVAWVLALRGGRLWARPLTTVPQANDQAAEHL